MSTTTTARSLRAATIRSASFDPEANTIEVVWTTGAAVARWDFDGEYTETLSTKPGAVRLDRLNAGAPFLDTHDAFALGSVIGNIVPGTARMEAGKGLATIQLSRSPDVSAIVTKLKEGVIRNVSVGYWVHRYEETGDGARLVTDWEPLEISAVPVPADPGAQVRSAGSRTVARTLTETERGAAHWSRVSGKPIKVAPLAEAERAARIAKALRRSLGQKAFR